MRSAKKVKDLTTGQIFRTMKEAAKFYRIDPSTLRGYLRGDHPSPEGISAEWLDDNLADGPEQWKPIPGYEGIYSISTQCRIRSDKFPGRMKKISHTANGQNVVALFKDSTRHIHTVEALYDLTWYGISIRSNTWVAETLNCPVRCVADGKVYGSMKEAAAAYHIGYDKFRKALKAGEPVKGLTFEKVGEEK